VLNLVPRHEDVWGNGNIVLPLLTSALGRGEWSDSRPSRFPLGESTSLYALDMRYVNLRDGLDAVEQRKISCTCRESNPGHSACSPSLYLMIDIIIFQCKAFPDWPMRLLTICGKGMYVYAEIKRKHIFICLNSDKESLAFLLTILPK
jgi:hypothetical protein